jgi:di/tricarboxylate transporter
MYFGLTLDQLLAVTIVAAMLGFFIWDRWRYDVVAMVALLLAVMTGIVPNDKAFSGFSDQVIVVIASVLVLSRAIARSGILERAMRRIMNGVDSPSLQIGLLSGAVALLSAFVKNVGTLGIFMPIAIQTARRSKQSASIYLMPLAFASLIGGTITQIGTSPNLIISIVRRDLVGEPFRLFDYAWVGLPLTLMIVLFLTLGWRLIPKDREGQPSAEEKFSIDDYRTELLVGPESPLIGKTVGDLEQSGDGDILITAVTREGGHHYIPSPHWPLFAGDIVTVQADPSAVKSLVDKTKLKLANAQDLPKADDERDELRSVEAIVTVESPLIGFSPSTFSLRQRYDVNLLSVGRAGSRRGARLQTHRFQAGDVVVLQGWGRELTGTLGDLGLLPLAERGIGLGSSTQGLVSLAILAFAMVLISLHLVSVAVGFFGAAVLVLVSRQISLKEAYESLEGPIIVMLAALIPIAQSLQTTGVTDLIGRNIAAVGTSVPGYAAVGIMLGVAMLLTPFLNNAAAVLVLGPVAVVVANTLGYNPDAFLMAVALGCACDFLTPIGHQNNLLVMAPGGYRFGDYWRLGLPLTFMVLFLGTPLILLAWPLS